MREILRKLANQHSETMGSPWAFILMLVGLAQAAHAAPNGLTQIPIAKVFGDGVGAFSLAHAQQDTVSTVYTAQYGLWNWLEVGMDYQAAPKDQRTLLGNAKVLLLHQPKHLPDLAAGLQNLGHRQKAVPYLVATTAPSKVGLSLGIIRPSSGSAYRGMIGVSYNVTPNFQVVVDDITGRDNSRTFGFIANLSKLVTLNLAYARPHGGPNADGFIFNLAYTLHLKGGGEQGGTKEKNQAPAPGGSGR